MFIFKLKNFFKRILNTIIWSHYHWNVLLNCKKRMLIIKIWNRSWNGCQSLWLQWGQKYFTKGNKNKSKYVELQELDLFPTVRLWQYVICNPLPYRCWRIMVFAIYMQLCIHSGLYQYQDTLYNVIVLFLVFAFCVSFI